MTLLIIGLLVFLGLHSVRVVADGWRTETIARVGVHTWKGLFALASIGGFVLMIWGYGLARQQPLLLWSPPTGMRHAAALLTLIAFVLLAATYVPRNSIQARLHHPMLLGTKIWAVAHLLSNGTLADVLLFGSFLGWAVLSFSAARRRDRAAGTAYAPGSVGPTLLTLAVGVLAWAGFAFWLHGPLIGVRPLG